MHNVLKLAFTNSLPNVERELRAEAEAETDVALFGCFVVVYA